MTDLINSANWGGAQWVLTSWFAFTILMWVALRVAGHNKKDPIEWWGGFIGTVLGIASTFLLLAWGGFWS